MSREVELPVVEAAKCIACGDCVRVCPTQCLAMSRSVVWLPRPGDCTSCAACEYVCPTDAIVLKMQRACDSPP